jgi:cbb3-type cytochrome oxidase subunit 1
MMPAADKNGVALRFFKAALFYFLITLALGVLLITGKAYALFNPLGARLAHVHSGLLGFVTLTIMGAMYQIVPTLTGSEIYDNRLANNQFLLINVGVLGIFLTHLLTTGNLWRSLSILFGSILLLASIIFAYLIFKTMGSRKTKIKPVTIPFFKIAILYYLAGVTMGLLIVISPTYFSRFLLGKTAHAHLGTLGWITMTIFGAEYQMFPMLSLQKLRSERLANLNLWTITLGVAGFWIGLMLLNTQILAFFIALSLSSILIFLVNMFLTVKGTNFGKLDVSVKYLIAGQLFLIITAVIGASMGVFYHLGLIDFLKRIGLASQELSLSQLIWTHAHLALIGFVTLKIIGAMYHLVPMLVWMEKYGPKMGKEKVPNIQDLFSQRIARIILWSSVLALVGMLVGQLYGIGLLINLSAYTFAVVGTLFTYAMYRIML